ncbi:MAG: hypothetical protein ACRCXB_22095 [Aeromonadaceae bacterium]
MGQFFFVLFVLIVKVLGILCLLVGIASFFFGAWVIGVPATGIGISLLCCDLG